MTQLENLIADKNISNNWNYLGLIQDVIERIDNIEELTEDDYDEVLYESIDSTIFYFRDQWTILEEKCSPQEANWDEAFESFYQDCTDVLLSYIQLLKERRELYQ